MMESSINRPVEMLITISVEQNMLDTLQQTYPRLQITNKITRRVEDIPAEVWARTEVLYTDRVLPDPIMAPNLRWIQFHYAGVEFVLDSPIIKKEDLVMTTASGAASPQLAEYAMMALLSMGHRMGDIFANQDKAEWPRDRWDRFSPLELRGSTVGIVGYGSIGREIARLLQPWDVKILAIKRDVMHPFDNDYNPAGLGDPEGNLFHRLYPIQAINSVFKESDFVIVTLPLTPFTRNLIGAKELASMKSTAYLICVGRGAVIDQAALLTALQERKFAGAFLDVFAEEPLPPTSPFWKMPNVIVSPHISGISRFYDQRAMAVLMENLQRYLLGDKLLNVFDLQRGY